MAIGAGIAQSWKQSGSESAVVYEDALPWKPDTGVCFEIKETREYRIDRDGMLFTWSVQFTPDATLAYTRLIPLVTATEWLVDRYRTEARLDILYRAHKDGVI